MGFLNIEDILPGEKNENIYETAEDACRAIYAGTYHKNCLIPVGAGIFQEILGDAVWVCDNEREAEKRKNEPRLVFTVEEFLLIVDTARYDVKALRNVIAAKRAFFGRIEEG